MKNETLKRVFSPLKEEDWCLIKTDEHVYSLRYGGYRREDGVIAYSNYRVIESPFEDMIIKEVYSDDHWLFILVDNDGVLSAGTVDISLSGETSLGVQFEKVSDFDKGFFESDDLVRLSTDESGWSVKQ